MKATSAPGGAGFSIWQQSQFSTGLENEEEARAPRSVAVDNGPRPNGTNATLYRVA